MILNNTSILQTMTFIVEKGSGDWMDDSYNLYISQQYTDYTMDIIYWIKTCFKG